jgi:flagellar biogenesis protein FliO
MSGVVSAYAMAGLIYVLLTVLVVGYLVRVIQARQSARLAAVAIRHINRNVEPTG